MPTRQPRDNIKNAVKKLHFAAGPNMDNRLWSDVLKAQEQIEKNNTANSKPNIPSTITKLAVAAVIIVTVFVGINQFGVSVNMVPAAFGEMIEAMEAMPWMHIRLTMHMPDEQIKNEYWYSFGSKVEIHKEADKVGYYDFGKHEQYVYSIDSKAITISYFAGVNFAHEAPGAQSPWDFVEKLIEHKITRQATVAKKMGKYDGREVEIHEAVIPRKEHEHGFIGPVTMKIIVDPQTHLPIAGSQETVYPDGVQKLEFDFDFSLEGPRDIYDVGVPESVQVVNNLPNMDAMEIFETYQARREVFFQQKFLSVVGISRSRDGMFHGAHVIYNTPQLLRTEHYKIEERFNPVGDWPKSMDEIGDTAGSVLQWLQTSGFGELNDIHIADGKDSYQSIYLRREKKWEVHKKPGGSKWNHNMMSNALPLLRHWLSKATSVTIIEDDYSQEYSLTCTQLLGTPDKRGSLNPLKCLIHFDPLKDYHWQRLEIQYKDRVEHAGSTRVSISEVKEFSQTEDGWFFPRVVEHWNATEDHDSSEVSTKLSGIKTVYLEMNPDFPEGLFDAANLPQ